VHAVLSDIHMPGARLDGIGLARWIRAHRPRLPVFLGSGIQANLSSADAALSSGPLLTKPYDFDVLEKGCAPCSGADDDAAVAFRNDDGTLMSRPRTAASRCRSAGGWSGATTAQSRRGTPPV
jgi:CheY-like chemotaxis protein